MQIEHEDEMRATQSPWHWRGAPGKAPGLFPKVPWIAGNAEKVQDGGGVNVEDI
jgi:hypothetical protein